MGHDSHRNAAKTTARRISKQNITANVARSLERMDATTVVWSNSSIQFLGAFGAFWGVRRVRDGHCSSHQRPPKLCIEHARDWTRVDDLRGSRYV